MVKTVSYQDFDQESVFEVALESRMTVLGSKM